MNNQNFYLRLIALLLIIMAVFFYNGTVKDKEQAQDIADLTAKVESLENQQNEILTALQETYEEQKARLLRTHLIQNLMVHLKKILQTTKGTVNPCSYTAYIFYCGTFSFFHSICRS